MFDIIPSIHLVLFLPPQKRKKPWFFSFLLFLFTFLFILPVASSAQYQRIIKGIVIDKTTSKSIEFVNVVVRNTELGTITDSLGKFEITLPGKASPFLIFSHINYYKQEIELGNYLKDNFQIQLIPKSEQLSTVVVSAGLYEQPMNKLTKPAAIISHRQILNNMNSNLTDMLSTTPGFTQVWEYHSPVILRGLNSNRLIIMKDGNRRIGTFPGGYFGQDMNIYDTKKVEVIKGPGSVIYGSGAISGIINVISNDPFGRDETNVKINSGYGSNNNEFLELVKICHKKENFGISLNGKYRKTGDMVYGNGETAENSKVEDRDLSLNTGVRLAENHTLNLNVNYHYGDWGKPRGFNGSNKLFTKIRNEEENIHTGLNYTFTPNGLLKSLNLNLFYDDGKRDYFQYKYSTVTDKLSTLDLVHYKDNYGGGRFFSIINLSGNNKLTAGADAYRFRLDNPSDIIDYYNGTAGTAEGYKNAGQQNWGVFISDEWNWGEKISLLTGIRYDAAKVVEGESSGNENRNEKRNAFSGNAGMVYSPQPEMHFSLNIGRAFRMPTAGEMFTKVISCKGVKAGNPDLDAEYSWNFDLGWRGTAAGKKLKYDFALFYNQLDDFINEAPAPNDPDVDFTYTNTKAEIMGGECSASYLFNNVFKPSNTLHAIWGAAYVYGIDKSGESNEPLFGIPPFKTSFDFNYRGLLSKSWLTGYFFKAGAEYATRQNRIPDIPEGTDGGPWGYAASEAHIVFNASLGMNWNTLPGTPKLRVIIRNMLNNDYQPYGSYIPAMGRNVKVLLSFAF